MPAQKKKKPGPAIVGNNSLRCRNCGEELKFPESSKGGYSIGIISVLCKAFAKEHRACKPSDEGRKRYEFGTPEEWIASWDTGTSSETIWSVMTNHPVRRHGTPRDPADFGRCYRLLEKFPDWRTHLPKVAERFPEWEPLVAAWPELTALYEEEIKNPDGMAPKLYARMKQLGC